MSTSNNLAASVKINVQGTMTDPLNNGARSLIVNNSNSYSIVNGTSSGQANTIWSDTRTITASSSENIDLSGALTDAFGNSILFTKIIGFIISAHSGNTNNVLVGGAASNAFINWVGDPTDIIVVRPGGTLALISNDATAYAVTAGTGDLLKIANSSSGSSVVYDITIIGCQ